METGQNSVAAVNKASVAAGVKLTQLGAEALAKVINLQNKAALRLYEESGAGAKLFSTNVADGALPQFWLEWSKAAMDSAVAYARDVTDVTLSTQSNAVRILDVAFSDYRRDILESVEKNVLHMPAFGGDWAALSPRAAINAMTGLFDATVGSTKPIGGVSDVMATTRAKAAVAKKKVVKKKQRK